MDRPLAAFTRRVTVALGGIVLGTVFAAALAEGAIRWLNPTPRVQIVDQAIMADASWQEGYPIWRQTGSDEREEPACAPGATEVLMVGSSITFGILLEARDTVAAKLQQRLGADGSAWCVHNVGQPAYTGEQKRIAAEAGIARWHPRLVIFEVWNNDGGDYVRVGDLAISTGGLRTDEEGWPASPVPLPTWLHHVAMVHSSAWRYAALALASRAGVEKRASWTERVPARLDRVAAAAGPDGRLLVWLAARLDVPFATQAAANRTSGDYGHVIAWGAKRGVPVIDPAAAWTGVEPAPLGVDRACHLNGEGADKVAAVLEPQVRALAAATAH